MTLKSTTELTSAERGSAAGAAGDASVVLAGVSTGVGRRRLLRAGLAATPVILAVSGRSAMATTSCPTKGLSPLAWQSLTNGGTQPIPANCSHTVTANSRGNSPGGWKPQVTAGKIAPSWPAACVPYSGYVTGAGCNSSTAFSSGTKFNQIFVGSPFTQFASKSFSEIFLGSGTSTGSVMNVNSI